MKVHAGMGLETDDAQRRAEALGGGAGVVDDLLVAQMDAIEISQGDSRAALIGG
jgi:hypothetical protein